MISKRRLSISVFFRSFCWILFLPWIDTTNDRIIKNLKQIVDAAMEQDFTDDNYNQVLIAQLSRIIEEEEGFQIVNQTKYFDRNSSIDGSGDLMENLDDDEQPIFYANMSIITITIVSLIDE